MNGTLCDLFDILNHNTNLQLGIIYINVPISESLKLPDKYMMHSAPVCCKIKSKSLNEQECLNCKIKAMSKLLQTKEPIWGMCVNGIWEYMYPIVIDENIIAIIYVGNILTDDGKKRLVEKLKNIFKNCEVDSYLQTMAQDVAIEQCQKYASIINSYFHFLYSQCSENEKFNSDSFILNIKNFIDNNYRGTLKISDLAKIFHYNEMYIGRYFKQLTGSSINLYVCRKRLEDAKIMLIDTKLNITEIATRTGFENISYFNKRFREYTGMSPSQYRNTMKTDS